MISRPSAAVIACFLAVVTSAHSGRAQTRSGALYVTTLPSGADVFVDGTYVGRAPVLVDALVAGRHALTITKTGWAVEEVDVGVPAGGTALSSTRLAAGHRAIPGGAPGSVIVRGAAAGATLSLDGEPFSSPSGQTVPLAPGTHRIAMTTARGRMTRTFTVFAETVTNVVLTDSPASEVPSAVVAPAEDYLPTDAFALEGRKIVVRYGGHVVVAHLGDATIRVDGSAVAFDSPPESISGKLYLPLRLLEKLTDDTSKASR